MSKIYNSNFTIKEQIRSITKESLKKCNNKKRIIFKVNKHYFKGYKFCNIFIGIRISKKNNLSNIKIKKINLDTYPSKLLQLSFEFIKKEPAYRRYIFIKQYTKSKKILFEDKLMNNKKVICNHKLNKTNIINNIKLDTSFFSKIRLNQKTITKYSCFLVNTNSSIYALIRNFRSSSKTIIFIYFK